MGFMALMRIVGPMAIGAAERLLGGKRGQGGVKKKMAVEAAAAAVKVLREAGLFAEPEKNALDIDAEIQAQFEAMNRIGSVNDRGAAVLPGAQVVIRGTIEGEV